MKYQNIANPIRSYICECASKKNSSINFGMSSKAIYSMHVLYMERAYLYLRVLCVYLPMYDDESALRGIIIALT